MIARIKSKILKYLLGGHLPLSPKDAIWMLIDEENQKPENEIRCDYIEAWKEAAERVKNYI